MLTSAAPLRRQPASRRHQASQRGIALIEALVATLLLMLGILALIGLQGRLVGASTDAQLRGEATFLADRIINQMWLDEGNLDDYKTSGGSCTSAHCTAWMTTVKKTLPEGDAVITLNGNVVQVSVLWTSANNPQRQVQVSSVIQHNNP